MSAMLTLGQDLLSETDLSPEQLTQLAVELRQAVKECKDRGLLAAAKWYDPIFPKLLPELTDQPVCIQGQRTSGIHTGRTT